MYQPDLLQMFIYADQHISARSPAKVYSQISMSPNPPAMRRSHSQISMSTPANVYSQISMYQLDLLQTFIYADQHISARSPAKVYSQISMSPNPPAMRRSHSQISMSRQGRAQYVRFVRVTRVKVRSVCRVNGVFDVWGSSVGTTIMGSNRGYLIHLPMCVIRQRRTPVGLRPYRTV
jgi:hypothetical protein